MFGGGGGGGGGNPTLRPGPSSACGCKNSPAGVSRGNRDGGRSDIERERGFVLAGLNIPRTEEIGPIEKIP